ncbi:transport permease protein [Geomonas sp. Red276]
MKEMIDELVKSRELLLIITWKDIKIRYKQSIMGFMWAVLMPMLIVAAGVVVKVAISFVSGKPLQLADVASISVKALPWSFFISAIRFATNSLTGNSNLITKIYFPREVFPLAAVLANLLDFAVASAALTVILAFSGIGVSLQLLWLPFLVLMLIMFTAGTSLFLACSNLFFRDVKYLVEVFLTFAIFFTPVFYDVSTFGKWAPLLLINPVGVILEAINAVVVLHQGPDLAWLGYACGCSVVSFLVGWTIFHRLEFLFAEKI